MKRKKAENNDRPKSSSFANGLALFSVFLVLGLILFGVFGKAGAVVTKFLTGVFGYAIYAYSVSGMVIGVALMLKRKRSVTNAVTLLYVVAVALVIVMIHLYSSRAYAGGTYGEYMKACYSNADTAGGWIGALLLYFPAKLYIVSEVLAGLLLVGVVALLIVSQLNKEITFRARQFGSVRTGKKKKEVVQTITYTDVRDDGYAAVEDERDFYNGDADGKQHSNRMGRRFGKKPVEYDDIEDIGSAESSEDYSDYYYNQSKTDDAISDKVVDEALDVYKKRRKQDAMDKLYNNRDGRKSSVSDDTKADAKSSWDILYGGAKKPASPAPKAETPREEKDIYDGYSNNSRIRTMEENLRRMKEEKEREESAGFADNVSDGISDVSAPAPVNDADEKTSEDDMTRNLFTNIDRLLDDEPKKDTDLPKDSGAGKKSLLSGSMDDFGEAEDKTEYSGDPLKGFGADDEKYERSNKEDVSKEESKPVEPVKPVRPIIGVNTDITPASRPVIGVNSDLTVPSKPVVKETAPAPKDSVEPPKPKKPIKRKPYVPPRLDCLRDYKEEVDSGTDFEEKIASVETCLANFGIDAKVVNVVKGPTFSRLELEVPPGISVNRIPQHYNDLAMCLAAESIRIEAPIPKKRYVGIEIPNENRGTVGLKPIINSREFNNGKSSGLFFALGKDIDGECYVGDITEFPHALVAGASGAGKSVCLNCMLVSMLYKYSPEDLRLILIDPKEVEFNKYEGLPHLLVPEILSDNAKIINALKWAIDEMERRYSEIKTHKLSNIEEYNSYCKTNKELQKMPYILIIIDEAADIMQSPSAKEFEALVKRLTAKARAAGIHIIVATQRPSVDVITGTIKANLPTRIAFAVVSNVDSKTILDYAGAEKLLRKGDMLYKLSTKPNPVRLQCAFISGGEVLSVVDQVKANNEAYFDEDIQKAIDFVQEEPDQAATTGDAGEGGGSGNHDPMFAQAVKLAIDNGSISISMLQRRLYLGFPRAAKLLDMMEARGFISKPAPGNKQRDILITQEEYDKLFSDEGGDGE